MSDVNALDLAFVVDTTGSMSAFITQYQSAYLSDEKVIDNFVVRTKEFERVMADIRSTPKGTSFQHYVYVGRRGSGKSTLLRRIQAEIQTDEELSKRDDFWKLIEAGAKSRKTP